MRRGGPNARLKWISARSPKGEFGIERNWHKRIVRAGVNTLSVAADNLPIRMVEDDDIVFCSAASTNGCREAMQSKPQGPKSSAPSLWP